MAFTQEDVGVVRIPSLSHSSGIVYTKKSAQKYRHLHMCILQLPDMTKAGPFLGRCIPPPPFDRANTKDSFLNNYSIITWVNTITLVNTITQANVVTQLIP